MQHCGERNDEVARHSRSNRYVTIDEYCLKQSCPCRQKHHHNHRLLYPQPCAQTELDTGKYSMITYLRAVLDHGKTFKTSAVTCCGFALSQRRQISASTSIHTTLDTHRFIGWEAVLAVERDGSDGRVVLEDGCRAVPLMDVAVHDSHGHLSYRILIQY